MVLQTGDWYEFGPFRLEPAERRLLRNGKKVPLPPKAFDVLVVLVGRAGHLVTKEELLRDVWAGTFVEDANLSYTVSLLRRALQTGSDDDRYIDTEQKLGYRFTGAVQTLAADGLPRQPAAILTVTPVRPTEAVAGPTSSDLPSPGSWFRDRRWGLVAVGVGALGLGLATAVFFRQPRQAAPSPLQRFDVTLPAHITLTRHDQPVISPDGGRVAYTGLSGGTRQLWVKPLAGPTAVALPGTEGAMMPFWSPDSRRLAFYADRKLKTIDVDGGPVTIVCGDLPGPSAFSGAWASGVIVFSNGPLYRVADKGGIPAAITRVEPSERRHFVRSFLSDGRRFLFEDMRFPQNVYVGSLDNSNQKHRVNIGGLASPIRGLTASRGHLVYAQRETVVAQAFDEVALEIRGTPIMLAETDATPWQPKPSASPGTLVFRSTGSAMRQLTFRGRDGRHLGELGGPAPDTQVDLSPSGTRAILVRGGPWPEDRDLWLADLTTGNTSILTRRPGLDSDPAWSADGGRIAYSSSRDGTIAPFVIDLDTGKEDKLVNSPVGLVIDDWAPDGRLVLRNHGLQVFALPVAGDRKPQLLVDTPYSEVDCQVAVNDMTLSE